jgi:hypothetical protein
MGSRCRCGTEVEFAFNHLGCIACGAACCPTCSYQLESANYCSGCAETLLELPWARPGVPAGGVASPSERPNPTTAGQIRTRLR